MVAIRSMPASTARSITSSRSASKSELSRWQWESTSTLLQPRPNRHILEETGQHRLPGVQRRGYDHSLRFDPAQFPRRVIRDDQYLAADQRLRLVGLRDPRHDRTGSGI